jgi:hypothetical protein
MTTIQKQLTHQEQLNKELREFLAYYIFQQLYYPNADETLAAVEPHFPELFEKYEYIDEILDECGIVAIEDQGSKEHGNHMRISYSVADNDAEAQQQLEKYQQSVYKEIRKALEIEYHWILKVHPNFWGYDPDALYNALMVFVCDLGKPEICIIKL